MTSEQLVLSVLVLSVLNELADLVADHPHNGLARGNTHQAGEKAPVESHNPLLLGDGGRSVEQPLVLDWAIGLLLSHQPSLQQNMKQVKLLKQKPSRSCGYVTA